MKATSKLLVAVGAGLAIGGLMGVLFAPSSGEETRKKIAEKGKKLTVDIQDQLSHVTDRLNHMNKGIKNKFDKMGERIEELS